MISRKSKFSRTFIDWRRRLNRRSPYYLGLQHFYLPAARGLPSSGSPIIDLTDTTNGSMHNATWVTNDLGRGAAINTTGSDTVYGNLGSYTKFAVSAFSVGVLVTPTATNYRAFVGTDTSSNLELRQSNSPSGTLDALGAGAYLIGTSTGAIPQNAPSFVVFTYDSTNWAWYINGLASGSGSSSHSLLTTGNCLLGANPVGEDWKGDVSDVLWFSRVLKPYEVQGLYREVMAGYPTLLTRPVPIYGEAVAAAAASLLMRRRRMGVAA